MNKIIITSFFISTFLITSVSVLLGITNIKSFSFILIVLIFLFGLHKKNVKKIISDNESYALIYLSIIIGIFNLVLNQNPFDILNILFFPIVAYLVLNSSDIKTFKIIQIIILIFFSLNCLISIIEYTLKINFFPEVLKDLANNNIETGFRSRALLGNPLNNALCTSIIMGYIYCSSIKNIYKFSLLLLGFVSFMAFNARGVILLWSFLFVTFLVKTIFDKKIVLKFKLQAILAFVLLISFSLYLLIYLKFGDRLFTSKIIDGSAQTRIDILDGFSGLNLKEFILGSSIKYTLLMTERQNGGYENSFIVLIYRYGIIMSFLIIYYLYKWGQKVVFKLNSFEKIVIFLSFVVAGNFNNGLFTLYPLYFFSISTVFIYKRKFSVY